MEIYFEFYSSSTNLKNVQILSNSLCHTPSWLRFNDIFPQKQEELKDETMNILNGFTDYNESQQFLNQQMQTFGNCLSGFMPINTQQYFFVLPNCFNNTFSYYPFSGSFQMETQNEALATQKIDANFQTNILSSQLKLGRTGNDISKKVQKYAKTKKNLSQKEEQEQSFNIKITKNEPCVTYKKKNTQSNIVNQTFSFLNSDRSKKHITKISCNSQKVDEYYKVMAKVKQLNKKYINRNYLKKLLTFDSCPDFQKAFLKAKVSSIKIEEITRILRTIIFNFLREQVNITLITSGKIYKETLPQHFWRKREILNFLFSSREI